MYFQTCFCSGPKGAITAVDVAGKLVAASSGDGCCYVWDAHGRNLHRLDAQSGGTALVACESAYVPMAERLLRLMP